MTAREYFDWIRADVLELAEMEDRVAALNESSCAPKAQGQGPSGCGSNRAEPMADRTIDAELELARMKAQVVPELDRACNVLYGRSGRGGVAKACGFAEADAVCGYYLYGMSWPEVADELVSPDSKDGAHWCRNRASSAFRHIDHTGMARLADS